MVSQLDDDSSEMFDLQLEDHDSKDMPMAIDSLSAGHNFLDLLMTLLVLGVSIIAGLSGPPPTDTVKRSIPFIRDEPDARPFFRSIRHAIATSPSPARSRVGTVHPTFLKPLQLLLFSFLRLAICKSRPAWIFRA
jgi:hypothetical protein